MNNAQVSPDVITSLLMTIETQSRNPFADPTLPTFADLIARIQKASTVPPRMKQNWIWALRAVARAAGKDPAAVPAHPEFVRSLFKRAAPASIGLSPAAWNNARSLTGKALEWAGLASMPAHYQAPLTSEWQELWDQLPPGKDALRMQLSRLFHFCSSQRIAPVAVNDEVLAEFNKALMAESIVELPYEVYRGVQQLVVPSRQQRFTYPWSFFPASLEEDSPERWDRRL
jgi:hypothetical protein